MNAEVSLKKSERLDDDTIDLLAVARTLWRGRIVMATAVIMAVAVGVIYAKVIATPIFKSTSVVMLESREASVSGISAVFGALATGDSSVVNTEVQVLLGRNLMGRVVDALQLQDDPEFNADLIPPSVLSRIKGAIMPSEDQDVIDTPEMVRDAVISNLLETVSVTNVPNSLVFQITASSISPEKAAKIADTIAKLYIDDQLRTRFDATEQAARWLTDQVTRLKQAAEASATKVRQFRNTTNLIDVETLDAMDRQIKEIRRRQDQTLDQANQIQAKVDAIEAATDRGKKAELTGNDRLMTLAHSTGEPAAEQFDTLLETVLSQLRADRERLLSQVRSLKLSENQLSAEIAHQSDELVQLDQLTRDAEATELLYEQFQARQKEVIAQQGINQADSRVISNATVAIAPASPKTKLIIAMTAFLGLFIGSLIVLLREMTTSRFRTTNELEALTGRTVLSQIPQVPAKSRGAVLQYLQKNPTSAPSEAIRNLRTAVLLSSVDKAPQVIAVTSSVPGEGKTTTTMALAQNFTALGRKVLVLEGDIRVRRLDEFIPEGGKISSGLLSVLTDGKSLTDAVYRGAPQIADILFSGKISANAVDLFSSDRFAQIIHEARGLYDIILIDTPPVLVVPDVKTIAQQADATLFVVRWDRTSQSQVQDALHQLEMVNIQIAGLVLAQVDPAGMRKYGYGDSYGAYSGYGKQYYHTTNE